MNINYHEFGHNIILARFECINQVGNCKYGHGLGFGIELTSLKHEFAYKIVNGHMTLE